MNLKNKFFISWLNKKADYNSKCQQIYNEINNLQDENKKSKLIDLLNKIKNICSNISNLPNKQQAETVEFLFYKSKNNPDITEHELGNTLDNIKTYFLMKEKNIQGIPKFLRNIKSFDELQNIIDNFSNELEKFSTVVTGEFGNIVNKYKIENFTDLDGNKYEVFKISKSNNQEDINTLRILAHGKSGYNNGVFNNKKGEGRWCVLQEHMATDYLSQDDFYVVYKNGKVFAGLGNQDSNCVNRINIPLNIYEWAILLKPFLYIDKELIENKFPAEYKELYNYVIKTKNFGETWFKNKLKSLSNIEEIIYFCLKHDYRYKEQEDNIIQYLIEKEDIENLYKYAKDCISNKFRQNNIGKKAEIYIAKNIQYSFLYAYNCLPNHQWNENTEVGQLALVNITKNAEYAYYYASNCLPNKQWNENTKIGKLALAAILQDVQYVFKYAKDCLPNEQWNKNTKIGKLALTIIAQNAEYAYLYAYYCLSNHQWNKNTKIGKLALNTITNNAEYAYYYAKDCLANKQWNKNTYFGKLALTTIANNAIHSYYYAYTCLPNHKWDENTKYGKIALNTIAKKHEYAYWYALNCLPNHKWDKNTPWWKLAIKTLKNSKYWYSYCELSIK